MLLTIEKLIYGGDGLARLPATAPSNTEANNTAPNDTAPNNKDRGRGKAVFVPFVLAGEQIEAALTQEKPAFARAHATEILERSPFRIPPPCPYYARCGGCHYQHAEYDHQLEIKKEILRENLRRTAKLELPCEIKVHPSPPWNYRNRSRLQLRTHPDFALGYFKLSSHELLPVEECPISSPLINRGIAAVWQSGRTGKAVEGVQEIELFSDGDDSRLLLEMLCTPETRRAAVRAWAEDLCAAMPEIAGVAAFREPQKGVQEPLVTVGAAELTYRTRASAWRVSAGAFFQTNRFLTDELVEIVTAGRNGEVALDLYAGVGLFSTALTCAFRHTVSVESSQTAVDDLRHNLAANGKAVHADVAKYLTQSGGGGRRGASVEVETESRSSTTRSGAESSRQTAPKPDLVIADPPRGGLGDAVARALAGLGAPRLTYVSCDPATLARDMVPLQTAGYRVEEAHLVDLFPQTYHLETVLHLVR